MQVCKYKYAIIRGTNSLSPHALFLDDTIRILNNTEKVKKV